MRPVHALLPGVKANRLATVKITRIGSAFGVALYFRQSNPVAMCGEGNLQILPFACFVGVSDSVRIYDCEPDGF